MEISAVNCTPIKPQFGQEKKEKTIDDAQKVLNMSKELSDSFSKENGQKTKLQTAVSIAGALLTTFLVGKLAGNTIIKLAPKLPEKLANGAKLLSDKAKTMKAPRFVQDVKFPENVQKGIKNISENKMVQDATSLIKEKTGNVASSVRDYVRKDVNEAFKTATGLASMAIIGKQIASVDGNGDGVADIAQKNVNAYKNAIDNLGVVGEIFEALK